MTTVRFFRRDGKFYAVDVEGHTGYADSGSDIVCAALSSVVQTAVLGLMQAAAIDVEYSVDEEAGTLRAVIPRSVSERQARDGDLILKTAYLGASDLYEQFSDFINLEVE